MNMRWIHAICTLHSDCESTDSNVAPYFSTHLNVGVGGVDVGDVVSELVPVVVWLELKLVVWLDVTVEVTDVVTVDVTVDVADVLVVA